MANFWQVALLLVAVALAGCDFGRADRGEGVGGTAAPVPGNIGKDENGHAEEPLPENIDGTYLIHELKKESAVQ